MADKKHMISNLRFENLETLIPAIEAVTRFCGEWQRNSLLEPAAVKSLRQLIIATSSAASTRIEGASLNNRQAFDVIRKKKKL